ncbi:MAG: hypothetical protein PVI86_11185 [Phycisphaerae bacterium]
MRWKLRSIQVAGVVYVLSVGLTPQRATAAVDLEWRAPVPFVFLGEAVQMGLYAVSDNEEPQPVVGVDAIMGWDPTVLTLEAEVEDGPFVWLISRFWPDPVLACLNADCSPTVYCDPYSELPYNDGDAWYIVAAFGEPPHATPEGLRIASFIFRAEALSSGTQIEVLVEGGPCPDCVAPCPDPSTSKVVAPESVIVTGRLVSDGFSVVACGTHGDFDADCAITTADFDPFASCLSGPESGGLGGGCEAGDLNGDGVSDLRDVAVFQAGYLGQ